MNNVKTIIERGVTMNLELKDRLEQICGKTLIEASKKISLAPGVYNKDRFFRAIN